MGRRKCKCCASCRCFTNGLSYVNVAMPTPANTPAFNSGACLDTRPCNKGEQFEGTYVFPSRFYTDANKCFAWWTYDSCLDGGGVINGCWPYEPDTDPRHPGVTCASVIYINRMFPNNLLYLDDIIPAIDGVNMPADANGASMLFYAAKNATTGNQFRAVLWIFYNVYDSYNSKLRAFAHRFTKEGSACSDMDGQMTYDTNRWSNLTYGDTNCGEPSLQTNSTLDDPCNTHLAIVNLRVSSAYRRTRNNNNRRTRNGNRRISL